MKPVLHNRPDSLLETVVLLYLCQNTGENLQHLPELAKLVYPDTDDSSDFFTRHAPMYTSYLTAFRKREKKMADAVLFLEEMSISDYILVVLPFLIDRDLLYDVEERGKEALYGLLDSGFSFLLDSGGALFDVTEFDGLAAYLSDDMCGDALKQTGENPCQYLSKLAGLIRENIPAAEYAWDVVRTEAQAFFDRYWANGEFFNRSVWWQDAPIRHIYPMISTYSSSFVLGDTLFCGLFNLDVRTEQERAEEKEAVLALCKALGDKKRVEMLLLFRERPYYNRELASVLDLSPATVMHHTDILLGCGLLKMMNQDENQKRIYFRLDEARLNFLLEQLKRLFQLKP